MGAFWRLCTALVLGYPLAFAAPARAEVESYLLFDMADGTIIARHKPTALWYPASITKLMTAYVIFEAVEAGKLKMTSPVTFSPQARSQPPSKMGFPKGTVITVETGLRIILTKSANDVSLALAEAVGGTQQEFMDAMNRSARALGMEDSFFDNPHGLPNRKQVTTARDIALLMMALERDFPQYSDFLSMSGVQLGNRRLRNHNALIRRFRGADGMKTGFICASGFNLAATATRDGQRLGAVVLGALTSGERNQRAAELLAKGFEALKTGGVVRLDGFRPDVAGGTMRAPVFEPAPASPDPLVDVADVGGERPEYGIVKDLPRSADVTAENRSAAVCVRPRPTTRYSGGVAANRAAVDKQRTAIADWYKDKAERETERKALLAAPLVGPLRRASDADEEPSPLQPVPLAGPPRALAGDELRPEAWAPVWQASLPIPRPALPAATGTLWTRGAQSDFAPDGWTPAPLAAPWRHPLGEQRGTSFPERPTGLPLGYLQAPQAIAAIAIRLGGADDMRPNPYSGPVVGGGRPPQPLAKPVLARSKTPVDPVSVLEHAADVREEIARPEG